MSQSTTTFDQTQPALLLENMPIPIKYLQYAGATAGQVPTFNGTNVVWATPAVTPGEIALTNAHILVGNGSNMATDVAVSGDLSLANTGAFTLTHLRGVLLNTSAATPFTNEILQYSGNPSIGWVNAAHQTGTASSGTVTFSGNSVNLVITTDSLTTAAGGTYALTIDTSELTSTSNILATATYGTCTTGTPLIVKQVRSGGSVVLTIENIHPTAAFNGTLIVNLFAF